MIADEVDIESRALHQLSVSKLHEANDQQLEHSVSLKRTTVDARTFQDLINTIEQQCEIAAVTKATTGRPQHVYQLLRSTLPCE
ncbi:MAG: hypothetical protein JNL58_22085 [Planctomyces sp.]|nr:hypothetical protein [Planctomyces sp.]